MKRLCFNCCLFTSVTLNIFLGSYGGFLYGKLDGYNRFIGPQIMAIEDIAKDKRK